MINHPELGQLLVSAIDVGDIPELLKIEAQAQSHPWRHANFIDSIEAKNLSWKLTCNDIIVAYALVQVVLDEATILNVVVNVDFQRKGVGRLLLQFVVAQVEQSCQMLFLEVRRSNRGAIALYESEDFFEVGIRKNYYPKLNGREDAIVMSRPL